MPNFRVDPTRTRRRRVRSPSFHHWTPGWWPSEYRHELVACCFNSEWFWDGRDWKEKKSFCIKSSRSYWQNNQVAEQVAGDLILRMTNTQRKNGSKLQGYQFGKTVTRGSIAKVKKCIHVATGQTVGIKILSFKGFPKINHGALEKFKKRVQREIFVAQHLKHSNVMTCYEGQMSKIYAYIVMEWMEGGSLLNYLEERGGTLTEWEAWRYFRQLNHGIGI